MRAGACRKITTRFPDKTAKDSRSDEERSSRGFRQSGRRSLLRSRGARHMSPATASDIPGGIGRRPWPIDRGQIAAIGTRRATSTRETSRANICEAIPSGARDELHEDEAAELAACGKERHPSQCHYRRDTRCIVTPRSSHADRRRCYAPPDRTWRGRLGREKGSLRRCIEATVEDVPASGARGGGDRSTCLFDLGNDLLDDRLRRWAWRHRRSSPAAAELISPTRLPRALGDLAGKDRGDLRS